MENEFKIAENYKLRTHIIITSNHKEYLNIHIENVSTKEEYNSNFDIDFLKNKLFFKSLNLQIIYFAINEQIKNSKAQINKFSNKKIK